MEIRIFPMKEKKPWLAGLLSLLIPGTGRIYAGDTPVGIMILNSFPIAMIVLAAFVLPLITSCDALGMSKRPTIVSHDGVFYPGSLGTMWRVVVGEVRNNGNTNLRHIKLQATYYTLEGQEWAMDEFYVKYDILLPGEVGPFMYITGTSEEAKRYKVEIVDYRETDLQPYRDFEIKVQQSEIKNECVGVSCYSIRGLVTNTGTTTAKFPQVYATCYNSAGEVVGVGYATLYDLEAGGMTDYWIMVYPHVSAYKISTCNLLADSEVSLQ
jgi:hypothetical protein